jgi:hypothetical protein
MLKTEMLKNGRKGRGCKREWERRTRVWRERTCGWMAIWRTRRKDSATAGFLTLSSSSFIHFVINGLRGHGR